MKVIVVADLHCGSTMGLWPDGIENEDAEGNKGVITLNPYQEWLQTCWWKMLDYMAGLPEKPVGVVNGDVIQGVLAKDGQLLTTRLDIQAAGAKKILEPFFEVCSEVWLLHGTCAHGGRASEWVTWVAKALGAVPVGKSERRIHWDVLLDVGGHLVHITHHVSATSLPFYEATAPLRDSYVLQAEYERQWGKLAPDVELNVRSHRHRTIYVYKPPSVRTVVTPCWQLKGEFAYKVATNSLSDIGYVEIDGDERGLLVEPHVFIPSPPRIYVAGTGGGGLA